MKIETLRKHAGREEIDYQFLLSELQGYANPRSKISAWLKARELVRVKKGLYIFGEASALQLYSKEVLANLIYGPSAISLTYALSFYGLVPEKVETVTSVTNSRNKFFATCIGDFQYYYLHPQKYAVGIVLSNFSDNQTILIASPEKALCDQIYIIDKDISFGNNDELEKYLLHDLRIDETLLLKFRLSYLREICCIYGDSRLFLLHDYIKSKK
jgi:predicted transcriptional regulator of viral defense system